MVEKQQQSKNFDITWLAKNDNNENIDNLPFTIIPP